MKLSAWKVVLYSSYIVFLISFSLCLGLEAHYLSTLKPVPDPANGAVYPLNWHGWIVYLNGEQRRLANGLFWVSLVSCVLTLLLNFAFFQRQPRARGDNSYVIRR
jgi:hypothetical protein